MMRAKDNKPALNRRRTPRHDVITLLPVNIVDVTNQASLCCQVDDVSQDGLGILTDTRLEIGRRLMLVTLRERFPLVVTWCEPLSDGRKFRVGLRVADSRKGLESIFASFFSEFQAS